MIIKINKLLYTLLLVCILNHLSYRLDAQPPALDSLWQEWENPANSDSMRLAAMDDYLWKGLLFSKPDSAFTIAELQYDFAKQTGQDWGMAAALLIQAISHDIRGNYDDAMDLNNRAMQISIESNATAQEMDAYLNIGIIQMNRGRLIEALNTFNKGLEIAVELKDSVRIGKYSGNIGGVYVRAGKNENAVEYFKRNMAIAGKAGNHMTVNGMRFNLGNIFLETGKLDSALVYFQKCLDDERTFQHKEFVTMIYNGLGRLYNERNEYSKALEYINISIETSEEFGSDKNILDPLIIGGMIYLDQGDNKRALSMCKRSYAISQKIGALVQQKKSCECLSGSYKANGNYKEALKLMEEIKVLEERIDPMEIAQELQNIEFDKELLADSLRQEEEKHKIELAHQKEVAQKDMTRNILMGGGLFLFLIAGGLYSRNRYINRSKKAIQKEKDRSDELLLNILPGKVAEELKDRGQVQAQYIDPVTVLFTDFVGFTALSEKLSPTELVDDLNECFSAFDHITAKYGIEKIKTIGDAYMAAGGLPVPKADHVRKVVLAALEMAELIEENKRKKKEEGLPYFETRIGIHTGPVVAGIVGVRKFQYDIWGDTVNTASRIESSGEVGKVNISKASFELIKEDNSFEFESRGLISAKGKGEIEMYFVSLRK